MNEKIIEKSNKVFYIQKLIRFRPENEEEPSNISRLSVLIRQSGSKIPENSYKEIKKFNILKDRFTNGVEAKLTIIKNRLSKDFQNFLDFIIIDRADLNYENLEYASLIQINDSDPKIYILFVPEMSRSLIYRTILIFETEKDNIQDSIVSYIDFLNTFNLSELFLLDNSIRIFIPIQETDQILNLLSIFESKFIKLNKLLFDFKESKKFKFDLSAITGKSGNYFSLKGPYGDLPFVLLVKRFINNIEKG